MAEDVFPVRSVRALLQNLRFLSLVLRRAPITRSRLQVLVQILRRRHTSAQFSRVTVKPFNFMVSFLNPAQLNMGLRQKGGSSSAKGERQELAATLRTFGKPFPPWMLTILWSPPKSLQVSASSPPHKLNLNVLISWSLTLATQFWLWGQIQTICINQYIKCILTCLYFLQLFVDDKGWACFIFVYEFVSYLCGISLCNRRGWAVFLEEAW